MASFSDTVAFCFPAAGDPAPYPSDSPRQGLGVAVSKNDGQEDLARGVKPVSLVSALRHYFPDWLLALLLWGVLAVLNRSGGHKREFSLNDISIQHTFAVHERVPPRLLAFVSAGVPLLVLVPLSLLTSRTRWDTHHAVLGLFMSYTMAGVVTQVVKMSVGRPRPDLIARCLPVEGAKDHPVFGLSTVDICTQTNLFILNDGFKSFPSGHSSLSFAGLGFLSLYLAGKMHLFDQRGHRTRAWFALSPLLGGAMVAISRTEDNRHHWQDVLVGSLLGLFVAWVSYRTYYPRLSHPQCHLPLAPADLSSEPQDEELGAHNRVRLLSSEREPRASEEEVAWRA